MAKKICQITKAMIIIASNAIKKVQFSLMRVPMGACFANKHAWINIYSLCRKSAHNARTTSTSSMVTSKMVYGSALSNVHPINRKYLKCSSNGVENQMDPDISTKKKVLEIIFEFNFYHIKILFIKLILWAGISYFEDDECRGQRRW